MTRARLPLQPPAPPRHNAAMPYRVIQWATGNVGRAAVEGILSHP